MRVCEKDIAEKALKAYHDVFADSVNVLLFNGGQIIWAVTGLFEK